MWPLVPHRLNLTSRNHLVGGLLLAVGIASALPAPARLSAQDKSVRPGVNKQFENANVTEFVERFEKEGRDVFDRREEVMASLPIKPGMSVADIGAGTGLYSRMLAQRVGEQGQVYAVDITENFISHLRETSRAKGVKNITPVLCKADSVELPPASIDFAFICDTYHHFEFPEKTMRSLHRALKPGGQIVLIDFHRIPGKSTDWILGHVRAGQDVFVREIESCGFKQVEDKKGLLKESYFVRFERQETKE